MNQDKNTDNAFNVCKKLIDNEKKIRELMFENIPLYLDILNNGYYKIYMGDENASWVSFLGLPEVTKSRARIHGWSLIHENLIKKFAFGPEEVMNVEISKLYFIAQKATSKEDAEDLISKARTLLPNEWREVVAKKTGKHFTDDGHRHQFNTYKICSICGEKHKES